MKVKFTNHAQSTFLSRGIPLSRGVEAVRNPDDIELAFEGKIKARKKFGKKVLEVVYFKEGFRDRKNECIVVTGYYL